jgi:hypothetical protein
MRAARTRTSSGGDGTGAGLRGRRLLIGLATAGLLLVPLVSLASTASARTGRPSRVPPTCTNGTYTVKSGDSWARISSGMHVTMAALLVANGATSGIVIHPGDVLCVPGGTVPELPAPGDSAPVSPAPVPSAAPLGASAIRQFPVQGACWFTNSWGAPRSGGRHHEGVDIIAKIGQFVYAADDGTLTKQYLDAPGKLPGNGWRITRGDGTYFFYGHLSTFAPGLQVGSVVTAGQIIGRVGMTGNAGVPHLHFEVHPGGGPAVDPTPIVKAVDGCATTVVPPQPGDVVAATPAPVTTAAPATTAVPASSPATTPPGAPDAQSSPIAMGGRWQFLAPATVFDSRGVKLAPARPVTVQMTGVRAVPAGANAVLVRVMARNVRATGSVTVQACGGVAAGTLSVGPGQPNATSVVVPIAGSSLCLTSNVALDAKVAVLAYQSPAGVMVQPVDARRVLDTRSGKAVAANTTRGIPLAALGAPAGTVAVSVNVTVIGPKGAGSIGVGACGGTPRIVSFGHRAAVAFSGVVTVNSGGLCVTSTATVHVVVDVTAVWAV